MPFECSSSSIDGYNLFAIIILLSPSLILSSDTTLYRGNTVPPQYVFVHVAGCECGLTRSKVS